MFYCKQAGKRNGQSLLPCLSQQNKDSSFAAVMISTKKVRTNRELGSLAVTHTFTIGSTIHTFLEEINRKYLNTML